MQPVTDLFVLAIFVMMPVLLVRSFRPPRDKDQARELEDWLEERLARQADEFDKKLRASQSALADQNYAAIRGVKDAVDGMGAQLRKYRIHRTSPFYTSKLASGTTLPFGRGSFSICSPCICGCGSRFRRGSGQ